MPAFVMDADIRILEMNRAAARFLAINLGEVFLKRAGEVLHCLHAMNSPKGCGSGPECKRCVIRGSVRAALQGSAVERRMVHFEAADGSERGQLELLVTASPLSGVGGSQVLLIMEDVTELNALKSIIPMCMNCRKLRNDQEYWQSVEQYFQENGGPSFSHGICPACRAEYMPSASDE